MTDFLAGNNACGQNLLQIVSMGNAIIAEILRLKDYIPVTYRLDTKADQQKYSEIILDFSYLKISEAQERKIEQNATLQELDDELRETHSELLTRFYLAFESTHQYAADLKQYIEELNNGYYIQQTLESVLQDEEGKQLLCESLYLFGVILLILDFHIPGIVRERLLIAYYRYSGTKTMEDSSIEDVFMLLRSTGFVGHMQSNKMNTVPNYPESYFARFNFDQDFVALVLGRLRCDDIYNQISIYPHPNHRSTALSTQGSMLYICLYFAPNVLHNQVAQMREIVDKFFPDNWVISLYMGITVNLVDTWEYFKAAKAALAPVVEQKTLKTLCAQERVEMIEILKKTQDMLKDGVLKDYYILEHINDIVILMRRANVLLRWYFLHVTVPVIIFVRTCQKTENVRQLVHDELNFKDMELYQLLLNCSELELTVKDLIREIVQQREERWSSCQKEAIERLKELSETFAGSRPLAKIEKNKSLKVWFEQTADIVNKQLIVEPQKAGGILIQVIQALKEVQEYHELHCNMHVKQYLQETHEFLQRMIQIINIKEDIEIRIQMISDFSYAWRLIDRDFTAIMQESIKKEAKTVIRIRATFLKLASALEIPLMRINQAKSEDLISVSNYYSTELAAYMRKVIQIIPKTMFDILAQIIDLHTNVIKEMPERVDKEKLRDYAQFDERLKMAKLTYNIAVFTEGILMMKKTLVGVIELDPKQLLEDGIRKELVLHLSNTFHQGLIFKPVKGNSPISELEAKLKALAKNMDGYRRSFEYIEDYLNVQGLRMLQEEMTRIINFNLEKECNVFLRTKVLEWQSQYQSETICIPNFPIVPGDTTNSASFIGRLAHEILNCTEPKNTIHIDLKATWYDKKSHDPVVKPEFFEVLREAIGPAGMVGLDTLYSYMLADELQKNLKKLQTNLTTNKMWCDTLDMLTKELEDYDFPTEEHAKSPLKFYTTYVNRWLKVWPTLLDWMLGLGHKQIVRQQIAFELSTSSKCYAKRWENALSALNRALLTELKHNPNMYSEDGSKMISEVSECLRFVGNYEPMDQVFLVTKNTHKMSLWLFLFTIAHLPRLQYSEKISALHAKNPKDNIDTHPFIMGILTILQQYHPNVKLLYLTYLGQFVNTVTLANLEEKHQMLSVEVTTVVHYLNAFIRLAKLPRTVLINRIPEIILNHFQYLAEPPPK